MKFLFSEARLSALVVLGLSLTGCSKAPYELTAQDNQKVMQAIKEDKVPVVLDYLDKGMNPNTSDATGTPFLLTAAKLGDTDLVYTFASHKAILDITDADGQTPLMAAVENGHNDIVTVLLDREADVNRVMQSGLKAGMTPLMLAAEHGYTDIVINLLQHGAKTNMQDAKGRTALMLGVASGQVAIVDTLLITRPDPKLNTDPNLKDNTGNTALKIATKKQNAEMIARLTKAGAKE